VGGLRRDGGEHLGQGGAAGDQFGYSPQRALLLGELLHLQSGLGGGDGHAGQFREVRQLGMDLIRQRLVATHHDQRSPQRGVPEDGDRRAGGESVSVRHLRPAAGHVREIVDPRGPAGAPDALDRTVAAPLGAHADAHAGGSPVERDDLGGTVRLEAQQRAEVDSREPDACRTTAPSTSSAGASRAASSATERSAACSSASDWSSLRLWMFARAAVTSPVNCTNLCSTPAGRGPESEVAVNIPHTWPATEIGTETAAARPKFGGEFGVPLTAVVVDPNRVGESSDSIGQGVGLVRDPRSDRRRAAVGRQHDEVVLVAEPGQGHRRAFEQLRCFEVTAAKMSSAGADWATSSATARSALCSSANRWMTEYIPSLLTHGSDDSGCRPGGGTITDG
jgi:hypothetical protein